MTIEIKLNQCLSSKNSDFKSKIILQYRSSKFVFTIVC